MTDIITQLEWRYAAKKFDAAKEISEKQLDTLKQAFNLTATSYGLQPIKLVVVDNKDIQQKLVAPSCGQLQVAQASKVLVICIESTVDNQFIIDYFNLVKEIRNTSEEILKPFRENLIASFSSKEKEEVKQWATNQAYLALGNLLTVCAVEGIDACPMEGFMPKAYDEVLGLSNYNLEAVLVLPVGYRAEDDMFADFKKVRKPLEETIISIL